MPDNKRLKSIVFCTAAKVEADIHTYPTHFHDVEEAKQYINTTCKQTRTQYITSKQCLTKEELAYIKDKVCFVVACRAFQQSEFYLKVALVDRSALRAAVEADIQRLLPLVPYWPPRFSGVKDALVHIDGVAQWREFTYTEFAGVEQERFRRYVNFNTVRHAFENGRFDMQVPGDDWQCRKSKPVTGLKTPTAKYATMNGAIEHDVQKLFTRIPAWRPSYPSLNAARDYVAESSRCIHFSYSYWHEIEPRRFRTIVNFSTAKRAFQLAKFEIYEGDVGEDESDGTDETAVEGAEVGERKMEVSMLLYGVSSGSGVTSLIETSGFSATTVFGDAIDSISIAIADTTADTTAGSISARLSEALSECASIVQEEAQASAMPSPETILPLELEVDEDPFKDLIAVLKRESILKAAFD